MHPCRRHVASAFAPSCAAVPLALVALIAAPELASAQQSEVAAWRVECTGDGKTLDCRAIQQLFHRETRQLLVAMAARKGPDAKTAAVTLQLPLLLNLTEPIQLKVDSGAAERQSIQTCTNVGCFVVFTATDKLVTSMRSGTELKITMQDANKRPVELALPLLGFGIAFDKARS